MNQRQARIVPPPFLSAEYMNNHMEPKGINPVSQKKNELFSSIKKFPLKKCNGLLMNILKLIGKHGFVKQI